MKSGWDQGVVLKERLFPFSFLKCGNSQTLHTEERKPAERSGGDTAGREPQWTEASEEMEGGGTSLSVWILLGRVV